jgi:hypothetical protein
LPLLLESIPQKYHSVAAPATQMFETSSNVLLPIYFMFIDKHWIYPNIFGAAVPGIGCVIGYFFIKETPIFIERKKTYKSMLKQKGGKLKFST